MVLLISHARFDRGALLFPELTGTAGFRERSNVGAVAGGKVWFGVLSGLWGGVGLTLRAWGGPWSSSTRKGKGAVGATGGPTGGPNSCRMRCRSRSSSCRRSISSKTSTCSCSRWRCWCWACCCRSASSCLCLASSRAWASSSAF